MRQQLFKSCLDRLGEAEGLLASVRHAEKAVASARQALAELSGEVGASPGAVIEETAEECKDQPAVKKSPRDEPAVRRSPRDEQVGGDSSKDAALDAEPSLIDQAVMDTMSHDYTIQVESPIKRKSSFFAPPRGLATNTRSAMSASRGWTPSDIRRGFICKPCCCGLQVPVFFPDCKYSLCWDIGGLVFIMFETFALPMYLSFGIQPTGLLFGFVSLVNVYFLLDIPLNFVRGFRSDTGSMTVDLGLIRRRYLKWIVFDILAGIPWEWLNIGMAHASKSWAQLTKMLRLLRVMRLLRLMRLQILPERVKIYIESSHWLAFANGVLRVLFLLFSITHWAACIWFYIGTKSGQEKTWISAHLDPDAPFSTEYMYSLYFTLTTMTTVGYGDITPQNDDEVLFTLILLLVATVVFATLMGALTDLICSLESEKHTEDARVRLLSHYMNWRQVPKDLFKAIRTHMLYLWDTNKGYDAYESEVKDSLPPVLRRELSFHVYGRILRSVTFLAWLWDYEVCLKELANAVHSLFLSRGDQLFRHNEPNTKIFVLQSGFVRISLNERLFSHKVHVDEDEDEAEECEQSRSMDLQRSAIAVDAFALPGRSQSFSRQCSHAEKLRERTEGESSQDIFHSKVMISALSQLHDRDAKQRRAASHIQRLWIAVKLKRKAPRKRVHGVKTKTVEAPSYFGEACLWEPLERWGTEEPVKHTYSACCESFSEVMVIPRTEVQQLIWRFSPWLRDRFESFRQDVVAELLHMQQEAERIGRGSADPSSPASQSALPSPSASPVSDTNHTAEVSNAIGEQLAALASRSRAAAYRLMAPRSRGKGVNHGRHIGALRMGPNAQAGSHPWANLREPLLKRSDSGGKP